MIATVHMLAGAAAGVNRRHFIYALGAGIVSHYVLDIVPHLDAINAIHAWNKLSWTLVGLDIMVGAVVGLVFWTRKFHFPQINTFVMGAAGGLLPDILDSQPLWSQYILKIPILGHIQMFHHAANNFPVQYFPMPQWAVLGIITQLIVLTISIRILRKANSNKT